MKTYKKFISFEGIDFSGKSTQIQYLIENLKKYKIEPVLLREPGGSKISEKIRDILLNPDFAEMNEKTEILLYEAARAQLVHQQIIPLLRQGKYVIADRFDDSTTAYQGYGRNLNLEVVNVLNRFATSDLQPYRTFFVDISPEEADRRRIKNQHQQDRLESGGLEFFKRVRQGFMAIAHEDTERFILINGERDTEKIAKEIWAQIKKIWLP